MLDLETIRELPKVELHRHLEGAIRPSTALDLFQKNRGLYQNSTVSELSRFIQVTGQEKNLFDFLEKIVEVTKCLKTKDDLTRITFEAIEDASNDNVIYLELRFSPHFVQELTGISLEESIEAVLSGKQKGEREFPVLVELILIMPQYGGEIMGYETVSLAKQFQEQGTRGIDIAGDIRELGLDAYIEVFEQARKENLGSTIHAGEITPADTVRMAVEDLGASRIGHGFRAIDDRAVVDLLVRKGILLEVCPISNLHTKAVSSIEEHPIRSLYESGVAISVNTDDPGISKNELSDDYFLLTNLGLCTKERLLEFNLNAIKSAFTTELKKNNVISLLKKGYLE